MTVELRKVMLFRSRTLVLLPMLTCAGLMQAQHKPNVVIIFTDDRGYQDLGCYGSPLIQTPSIDGMAREGLKLTDFYVSASVSSASRAGLLTGRLNTRNGVKGVFFPESEGMSSEEITLAEALKEQGYATGCFGKWHLGDLKGHLPTDRGLINTSVFLIVTICISALLKNLRLVLCLEKDILCLKLKRIGTL